MWTYRTDDEFYVHEKFGNVPKGWDVKPLSECFDFFPTASYSRSNLTETGDCCYIHYGDIHTKFHVFLDFKKEQLPFVSHDMAKRFTKLEEGDLIIADASEDYHGVGKAVEVINIGDKAAVAGLHTLHLRCKNDCFVKGFRGYILNNEKVRISILRIATGIKVYSVTKTDLKKILLPQPPEPEQTAIATILSKLDEAIAATENSIKAAEKLKKAMIQTLLTGKLKPDGTWRKEDEFYVDEKFGNIPVGWVIKKGNKITEKITKGQSPKWQGFEYGKDGMLFITSENVREGYLDINEPKYLPVDFNEKIKNSQLKPGDILINIVGASIGRSCIFNGEAQVANINQAVCLFRLDHGYHNLFFAYYFQHPRTIHRLLSNQVETARANLSLGDFRKLKLIFPNDPDEQKAIADKIIEFDKVLQAKQAKIKSLVRLKKSLMQNLLTGKVRLNAEVIDRILQKENREVMEDAAV